MPITEKCTVSFRKSAGRIIGAVVWSKRETADANKCQLDSLRNQRLFQIHQVDTEIAKIWKQEGGM
jgi:hypothetical protein